MYRTIFSCGRCRRLCIFVGADSDRSGNRRGVQGGITEQTRQSFSNLFHVLEEAGLTPDDVQQVKVYLTDMENFEAMNAVYAEMFTKPYPARVTIGVTGLCGGALIEIEMLAKR